jgi:hypothetical protein
MQTHSTTIELSEPVPAQVAVGTDLVLKLKVSCSAGCDLCGTPVTIAASDGAVATAVLAANANEGADIAVKAPQRVGEHAWTITVEPREVGGIPHEQGSLPLTLTTIPQGTSLAVWDIPSPVVMGMPFEIKVGAKSAADCALTDTSIEVCDEIGAVAAHGRLGETPWPGTSALYWTAIELIAPRTEGLSRWSVRFAAAELALPHDGAAVQFSVTVVKPPEHRLTVTVIEKESKAPIEDVQVRLGAYRGATDSSGVAEVMMPKGAFELHVWKAGYEAPAQAVDICADISVQVEASIIPEDDPDAAWTM